MHEAGTQYGDQRGTASVDGTHGPIIHELGKLVGVPGAFFPVGFELYRGESSDKGMVSITVFAVDQSKAGASIDAITQRMKRGEGLVAQKWSKRLPMRAVFDLFHRYSFVLWNKAVADLGGIELDGDTHHAEDEASDEAGA